MRLEDIPIGEGRAMAMDGQQIAVFRLRNGTVRALSAVCPHLGGPLADGIIDNRIVICPLHNRTYDLDSGVETSIGGPSVVCYAVSIDPDGEVSVRTRSSTSPSWSP